MLSDPDTCRICSEPRVSGKTVCVAHLVRNKTRANKRSKGRRTKGLCRECPEPSATGRSSCAKHLGLDKIVRRNRVKKARANGLCSKCLKDPATHNKSMCAKCTDKLAISSARSRKNTKMKVINHYGGKCACCGENKSAFLTIDHVNNNGNDHRKTMPGGGSSTATYRWIIKNNYPTDLQLLCWNCNCGKQINGGICPHKDINFVE